MSLETLSDLFLHELKDVYSAEHQILKALPKVKAAITSRELLAAVTEHEKVTRNQVGRLEQVFQQIGEKPKAEKCEGMAGLIKEAEKTLKERAPGPVKDAGIIASLQRIEHYEVAAYGALRSFAKVLGDLGSAKLLQASLDEEGDCDRSLSQLADFTVNLEANAQTKGRSSSAKSAEGKKKESKVKNLTVVALCLVLPLALGCREKAEVEPTEVTPSTTESEVPGVGSSSDLSPATAQARIDDVTIGHTLAPDGTIAADQQGDDFAPGEPVQLSLEVGDTPAGSAVKVVWFAADESRLGEETKTVAAGEKYLTFTSGDTSSWAEGDYRAEVWLGDEKVNTQQFQIVKPANAGK